MSEELIALNKTNYSGKIPNVQELINIEGVDLDYSGKSGRIKALKNISFNIFPGEFVCVLGPSGCGKVYC